MVFTVYSWLASLQASQRSLRARFASSEPGLYVAV